MSKKDNSNRAKLIFNPGSGDDKERGKVVEKVTRWLKKAGVKVDIAVAKPHEKAIPITRQAVKDGYKTIIAMGGDDTVEAIIRGMAGSKARLGIIAVGTANDLAKSLGIPEDPEKACELIASGHVRKLDLGQVKTKKGEKFIFFELVTVGIAASIYPSALHVRKKRFTKIVDVIQTFLKHESDPKVTLKLDGDSSVTVKTMLTIVSNVPMIGPNMIVDPNASLDDGLFDISVYPNFSKADLLAYSAKVLKNNDTGDGSIQRYRAATLKIKADPKQDVMADGVMLGKGTIKIKVLPRALRVIAPKVGAGIEKPPDAAGTDLPAPVAPAVLPEPGKNGQVQPEGVKS